MKETTDEVETVELRYPDYLGLLLPIEKLPCDKILLDLASRTILTLSRLSNFFRQESCPERTMKGTGKVY